MLLALNVSFFYFEKKLKMTIGFDKFYPKAYLPVKPNVEHPPPFEPLKVIQPVDPFHNAFFYTNDQQNNILSQQYKPEVVIPMMYRRRHKHEFEPISPIPGDAPPTNIYGSRFNLYGSRFNHPDNTLTSDFVAQPSIEQKPALLPFSLR